MPLFKYKKTNSGNIITYKILRILPHQFVFSRNKRRVFLSISATPATIYDEREGTKTLTILIYHEGIFHDDEFIKSITSEADTTVKHMNYSKVRVTITTKREFGEEPEHPKWNTKAYLNKR